MVVRKKSDTIQLSKIRMKEDLRRRLVKEAEQKRVTLNAEIVTRLEASFSFREELDRLVGEARDHFNGQLQLMREAIADAADDENADTLEWMVGSDAAASDLLRSLVAYMQLNKEWKSAEGRQKLADFMRSEIVQPAKDGGEQ